jgi:hypothetical protein
MLSISDWSKSLKDWKRNLLLPQTSRVIALAILILLSSLILGTVNLVMAPAPPEQPALGVRQFQLGSILGVNAIQASGHGYNASMTSS